MSLSFYYEFTAPAEKEQSNWHFIGGKSDNLLMINHFAARIRLGLRAGITGA